MSADQQALIEELGRHLALMAKNQSTPVIVGLSGAQGSGKSTLARMLAKTLQSEHSAAAVIVSLDDLYLTKAERTKLGLTVHPLCATRGVPGTHDVALGLSVFSALKHMRPGEKVNLPRFDKLVDDRVPNSDAIKEPPDVILFEGWCVGAGPHEVAALVEPLNDLERQDDPDGTWRRWSNDHLQGAYQELWRVLDLLILIQVPDLEFVIEARLQQEREMAAAAPDASQMSREQVERFVAHYERLTRHIWATMPDYADAVLARDASGFRDLRFRKN